jgi:vitamin B12 transporter
MKKIIIPLVSLTMTPLICLADTIVIAPVTITSKAYAAVEPPLEHAIKFDRATIETTTASDVADMTNGQPGLQLNQSKPGSGATVALKGASGGLGLLTLDGIPLFGNFAAYYSLGNYSLDVIESISISRNEGLPLENSRTLGGVIQLNSRRMAPGAGMLHLEAGSKQTVSGAVATGIGSDLGDISLAAGWRGTFDGASQAEPSFGGHEGDNQRHGHALVNIGKKFERGDLFTSLYYARADDDIDGPGFVGSKVLWTDDPNGWFIGETLVGQISAKLAMTDRWQSTLQLGGTRDAQDGMAGRLQRFSMRLNSDLWLTKWQNVHALPVSGSLLDQASLLWGLEYQDQHGESHATGRQLDKRLFSPSLGLSWAINQWDFYAKLRQDHIEQNQTEHDGDHNLWSAGVAWHLTPDSRLWANAGKTFRMAAVNEVLHPLFGNINLKPESGQGWDVGWTGRLATSTSGQLNYYHQHYRDLILLQTDPFTGVLQAGNMSDAVVRGFEAELRQTWTPRWNTTLQYGYMDAENRLTYMEVQARPRNKLTLQNNLRFNDKLDLSLDLRMHDGFWNDNQHLLPRVGSVVRLNGTLNYAISPTLTAYLRAENLTDNSTSEAYGLGYPARAFYVGVKSAW